MLTVLANKCNLFVKDKCVGRNIKAKIAWGRERQILWEGEVVEMVQFVLLVFLLWEKPCTWYDSWCGVSANEGRLLLDCCTSITKNHADGQHHTTTLWVSLNHISISCLKQFNVIVTQWMLPLRRFLLLVFFLIQR